MHFAYCTKTASFVWRAVLFARKSRSNLTIPYSLYLSYLNEYVDADGRIELIGHYYSQSRIEQSHLLIMGMISNVSNLYDLISGRKTWIYIFYTLSSKSEAWPSSEMTRLLKFLLEKRHQPSQNVLNVQFVHESLNILSTCCLMSD